MSIDETDRLALRQELERVFNNPRHADTLMRSLPPTEHEELATRSNIESGLSDLHREIEVTGREVRAEIKGEIAELTKQMTVQFRLTVLMQMGVLLAVISLMATRA